MLSEKRSGRGRGITSVGNNVEKFEPPCSVENGKWYSPFEKQYNDFSKIKYNCDMIQQLHFWVYTQKIQKWVSKRYSFTHLPSSIVHHNQKAEQPKCPSTNEWMKKCGRYIQWDIPHYEKG
jgi:hypothetical protein